MPDLQDHEERIARTERNLDRLTVVVDQLASRNARLDDALAALLEAQIRTQEQFIETDKRFLRTDERIDKLVSAIGEFIRTHASNN